MKNLLLPILLLALTAPQTKAQEALSREQRARQTWETLPPQRREYIWRQYEHYRALTLAEKRRLLKRFQEFDRLTEKKKQELARRWHQFQSLPPKQRREIIERWITLQRLNAEKSAHNSALSHKTSPKSQTHPDNVPKPKTPGPR